MKQRLIQLTIILIALALGGLAMTSWHRYANKIHQLEQAVVTGKVAFIRGRFSSDDILEIRKLIATKTDKDILSISSEDSKEIEVMTGFQRGPLEGGGTFFTVKKENEKWVITDQGVWAS